MKKVETMRRIGTLAMAGIMAMCLAACGNNNDNNPDSQCADGQIFAQLGDEPEGCFTSCEDDDDCLRSETCMEFGENKVCVEGAPLVCDNPPDDFCEGSVAVTHPAMGDSSSGTCVYTETRTDCEATNNACNLGVCEGPSPKFACEQFANLLLGDCATTTCTFNALDQEAIAQNRALFLNGGTVDGQPRTACEDAYRTNGDLRAQVNSLTGMCGDEEITQQLCDIYGFERCGCPVPADIGEDCSDGGDVSCDGQLCLQGTPEKSFCSATCDDGGSGLTIGDSTGCGADVCLGSNVTGLQADVCEEVCSSAQGEECLDADRACVYVFDGDTEESVRGYCDQRCDQLENGCSLGLTIDEQRVDFFCDQADGTCEFPCDPTVTENNGGCPDGSTCVERMDFNTGTPRTGSCQPNSKIMTME
ncbi:MAG: hypothetical protein AAGI01_10560 [Myxococcota bacterium]